MNEKYHSFLENIKNRALSIEETGNKVGAAYIACILGMWTHVLHEFPANPFKDNKDSVILYKWFQIGFDASEVAVEQDEELKKIFAKYESTEKKHFWGKKRLV